MLDINNVTKSFQDLVVLKKCTLHIKENTIRGLIGPNGAGKTTLLNTINGFCKPNAGSIYFENERIDGLKPHKIAKKGIGRTFQITRPFHRMTVMDNIIVAGFSCYKNRKELKSKTMELLKFFNLYQLRDESAGNLSGGQKKLLEMARALILEPDLLLLDEPFHGIHPLFKRKIIKSIRILSKEGKTFLIVSHDIPSIVHTCDTITVLCAGEVIAEGTGEDIRTDERVIEAYLGV